MDQSLNHERATSADPLELDPVLALTIGRHWIVARRAELVCGALLLIMSLQMFAVISRKSITIDEIVMIPAAYYHLAAGNFQLVNEHPPLVKLVAGFPILFIQPRRFSPDASQLPHDLTEVKYAFQERFWVDNTDRFESLSFWPRLAMIVFTCALGVLIFWFARELFGARAAIFSVILFSLEPTILAHGKVVQTDIPAALGFLLFFIALHRYTNKSSWRAAAWLGATAAIAILAKFSMLLVGLVLLVFFIAIYWRQLYIERRTAIAHLAVVLLTLVFSINVAYFFRHAALSELDSQWIASSFPTHVRLVTFTVRVLSFILPKDFLLGILFQFWHSGSGHSAALLGMYSQKGWWYYFPVAFALKTTLPFLALVLVSIVWATAEVFRLHDWRFLWLLAPVTLYTIFLLFSPIDIGVRYYLPAYPFLFILGATFLDRLIKSKRARIAALVSVIVCFGWIGIEAMRAFPNHVSYMNELAAARPHWWYLSDSNIEWGDDLRGLALYLRARGETRVLDATLGGFAILREYGIERIDALTHSSADPGGPNFIAIGASYLNGSTIPSGPPGSGRETDAERVNFFDQYRHRPPEAVIGDSIYVFRVR